MKHSLLALFVAVTTLASCTKEDPVEPTTATPTNSWALRVIPRNDGAITVKINGQAVDPLFDANYPNIGELPTEYQPPVQVYYLPSTTVNRGDIVRVTSAGSHDIVVGVHTVARVDTGSVTFTVYP